MPGPVSAERFEALLAPVLGKAYATALHLARDAGEAENLVQEAALRGFRSFHTFQEGTNFRAWFLRIVTNLFFEELRRKKRAPETVSVDEGADLFLFKKCKAQGDAASEFMKRLSREGVARALVRLPVEFRVVCSLFFVHELGYQEIAETVGVPVGTVRSRLHRGRKMLQAQLWEEMA